MWPNAVRSEFPVLNDCLYFNTGTMGPSPDCVTTQFADEYRAWQHRGPGNPRHYTSMRDERLAPFRQQLAETLGVTPHELALTANSTDGVNIVAWGFRWEPGDEVIIGSQEHPAVFVPWLHHQKLHDIRLHYLPFLPDEAEFLAALEERLTDRTRLVVISHVSTQTGLVIPAERVVKLCHEAGVQVMFDGAQAFGQLPVNIRDIGCDYYTFNGHKWCLGPVGTGAVFIHRDRLKDVVPSWVGSGSTLKGQTDLDTGEYQFRPSARRYEFATRNWALYLGWKAALDFMAEQGWERVWERTAELTTRFKQGVKELAGVELLSPLAPAKSSGLTTVRFARFGAVEAVDRLMDDFNVVTRAVPELDGVRFSCAFFNLESEIDEVLEAIDKLAH